MYHSDRHARARMQEGIALATPDVKIPVVIPVCRRVGRVRKVEAARTSRFVTAAVIGAFVAHVRVHQRAQRHVCKKKSVLDER